MADVLFDRAHTYRKRAKTLRVLADGMVRSGGNGDLLRGLAAEYDRMAVRLEREEETAAKARDKIQAVLNPTARA
jgi:hypothetical protein